MQKPNLQPRWLPSGRAAECLGIGKSTLRRYADQGLLTAGTHFQRGLTPKSPWRWEVTAIAGTLERLASLPSRPAAVAALNEGPTDG
jgi:hypothetical protein